MGENRPQGIETANKRRHWLRLASFPTTPSSGAKGKGSPCCGACYGTGFEVLVRASKTLPRGGVFSFGVVLESGLVQSVVSAWISGPAPSRFTMRLRL